MSFFLSHLERNEIFVISPRGEGVGSIRWPQQGKIQAADLIDPYIMTIKLEYDYEQDKIKTDREIPPENKLPSIATPPESKVQKLENGNPKDTTKKGNPKETPQIHHVGPSNIQKQERKALYAPGTHSVIVIDALLAYLIT